MQSPARVAGHSGDTLWTFDAKRVERTRKYALDIAFNGSAADAAQRRSSRGKMPSGRIASAQVRSAGGAGPRS